MRRIPPWLRTLLAFPLGLAAIVLFHRLVALAVPAPYADELDGDAIRIQMLLLACAAGIVGSCVAGLIAGRRLWLHIALFTLLMAAVDASAVAGVLAPQPVWLKVGLLCSLPPQAALGGLLAALFLRRRRVAVA